jgi:hypothetical protein
MVFECFRCGYKCPARSKLVEHLSRKNVCEPIRQNISVESVYNHYQKIWNEKKVYRCDFCELVSDTNDVNFRNHKVRCKKKADNLVMKSYEHQFLKKDEEELTIEQKYKKACEQLELVRKENEKMKTEMSLSTTSSYGNSGGYNSSLNGDHCSNYNGPVTNNINITINALGKEDLTHLLDDKVFKKKMDATFRHATRCWDALPYLIQNIHYGKESNKNVIVKDPNDKYVFYYNGTEWMVAKKAEVFDKIMLDNWKQVPVFVSDATLDHKYFKKVDEAFQDNEKYNDYLQGQVNVLFSNDGKNNVFDNTGNETAAVKKINKEFLLS